MKAPPFEYVMVDTVEQAVAALGTDPEARVLAGGQSLAPLLALRLARPSLLVDVNRLPLDTVAIGGGDGGAGGPVRELRLGALVRHRTLERDDVVAEHAPLFAEAARHIGDAAVRNRGTLGGSLAHADPAAELPTALVALGGRVVVTGVEGTRELAAGAFFESFFVTGLAPGELLTEVVVPASGADQGSAFVEWAPRAADFALAGVAVTLTVDERGACIGVGAAACGVGSVPVDLVDALTRAGVLGADGDDDALWPAVAVAVERECTGDDDRAELAGLLAARAVRVACARARRAITAGAAA